MKYFSNYLIIIGGVVGTMGLQTPFVNCGDAEHPSLTMSQFRGIEKQRQTITTKMCDETMQASLRILETPVMSSSIIPGVIVLLGLMGLSKGRKNLAILAIVMAAIQTLFVGYILWRAQQHDLTLSQGAMTAFACGLLAGLGGLFKYRSST